MAGQHQSCFVVGLCLTIFALLLRWSLCWHPHSGQGKGPMFGDFEAQRHWMEITVNLPATEWYENTSRNNLTYWGLDYPPLTAYHSWFCGQLGSRFVPESFVLQTSRGDETPTLKVFMRLTVIISDIVIFVPAVFLIMTMLSPGSPSLAALALLLFNPLLLLVDHGHFQFNGVAIGLALMAVNAFALKRPYLSALLFTLALNFKQMLLYYSLPFFFALLGQAFLKLPLFRACLRVILIGAVVGFTFALLWAPWLFAGPLAIRQVIHRLFPFERGLYEDKVANIWCTISPLFKWRQYQGPWLIRGSALATLLSCLPSCLHLFFHPNVWVFIHSLVICAFGFFLLSFQVHEKTILIPIIPACLLLARPSVSHRPSLWVPVVGQLLIVALFSCYPLALKDRLEVAYFCLFIPLICGQQYYVSSRGYHVAIKFLVRMSSLGMVMIHTVSVVASPPPGYPDIITLLFTTFSCLHFVLGYLLMTVAQFSLGKVKSK